ncbi:unnamed protein product [Ambrosiozyma monospora]|uniref:Unnamed protein product n=1 Tax=Ambrosiozyma monospora TaxID=43982 RepID=A0ACB5U2B6_AMBMO|nr:unnamed protein product [Ambrosiozyma monospora]
MVPAVPQQQPGNLDTSPQDQDPDATREEIDVSMNNVSNFNSENKENIYQSGGYNNSNNRFQILQDAAPLPSSTKLSTNATGSTPRLDRKMKNLMMTQNHNVDVEEKDQDVTMMGFESTPIPGSKKPTSTSLVPISTTTNDDSNSDSTPIKPRRRKSISDTIRNFKEKLPTVLASLNETFDTELAEKNEEIEHNRKTLQGISKEIEVLDKNSRQLLQVIFKDDVGVDYERFLDHDNDSSSSMKLKPSSFHHNNNSNSSKENLDMLLQDKLISSREEFEEKSNYLVNIYERSQALELAKLRSWLLS